MSLDTNLQSFAARVATEIKSHKVLINNNAADLSALTTTAKGNLVAAINEVNAAVGSAYELLDEIAGDAEEGLVGHLLDPSDAHAASAISVVPTGQLSSTDVQSALEEVQVDASTALSNISSHASAPDPHPQYLTQADGDARYDVLGAAAAAQSAAEVYADDVVGDHEAAADPHPQYLTPAEGNAAYEPKGAVQTHEEKVDPHPQYLTETEGDELYDAKGSAAQALADAKEYADDVLEEHVTDPNDAHMASAIGFEPVEDVIESINVQAAIVEVATNAATSLGGHIDDPDPHPQYLTVDDGNGLYEPKGAVGIHEAQLDPHPQYLTEAEADGLYDALGSAAAAESAAKGYADGIVADHVNDATAAHAATAISFTPAGTIAATNVQAALVEVATEAATGLGGHISDPDPHPQYLTLDEGEEAFEPLGAVVLHESALDPHPQYETATEAQNRANQAETNAKNYTDQKIADLIDNSPSTLDTLNELAAALGDDPNFAATVTNMIGGVADDLEDHILDATAAHAASAISFSPTGSVSATTVQAAIAEVASEYAAADSNLADDISDVADDLSDHISDTTDAHAASAISFTPTGSVAATTVQAAIAEVASEYASADSVLSGQITGVQSNLTNHINDGSDAHDASAISFDASLLPSWLTSTQVQGAIAEVAAEIDGRISEGDAQAIIDALNDWSSGDPIDNPDIFESELILTRHLATGSVVASKIGAGEVNASHIAAISIQSGHITADAIKATHLDTNSVTTDAISAGAVTATELAAGAVTATKISSGAVETDKLAAGAVTALKIAADAVQATHIDANAVQTEHLAASAVTAGKIATNAVTADKINAGAVTAAKIEAGAVTTAKLDAGAVTAAKLAADAVEAAHIKAGVIDAGHIASNAITTAKLNASAVTAEKIATNAITTDKINANAVTADKIQAGAVTTAKLDAGAVTTDKVAAGAITAQKIAIGDFSNLFTNPRFDIPNGVVWGEPTTEVPPVGTARQFYGTLGSARYVYLGFPIVATDEFVFEATVKQLSGTNPLRIGILPFTVGGGTPNTSGVAPVEPTEIADLGDGWKRVRATITAPNADATYAHGGLFVSSSLGTSGWLLSDVVLRRRSSGELLVDGSITAGHIAASAVTTDKLSTNAVTADKINANAVTTAKINALAVTTAKLAAGAVTAEKISADAIEAGHISAGAIETEAIAADAIVGDHISSDAITSDHIVAGAITASELAANAVTAGKIAADAVDSAQIKANAITSGKIASDQITASHLQTDSVTADKIQANAVTTDKINASAVTANKIATNAVTANKIAANAVTAAKIATGAVETAKLAAGAVTAEKIAADAVEAGHIKAGAVEADAIGAGVINGTHIAGTSITASHIVGGTITGNKIASNQITGDHIVADAIKSAHIDADAIKAEHIDAGQIKTEHFEANRIQSSNFAYTSGDFSDEGSRFDLATGTIITPGLSVDGDTGDVSVRGDITADSLAIIDDGGVTTYGDIKYASEYGFVYDGYGLTRSNGDTHMAIGMDDNFGRRASALSAYSETSGTIRALSSVVSDVDPLTDVSETGLVAYAKEYGGTDYAQTFFRAQSNPTTSNGTIYTAFKGGQGGQAWVRTWAVDVSSYAEIVAGVQEDLSWRSASVRVTGTNAGSGVPTNCTIDAEEFFTDAGESSFAGDVKVGGDVIRGGKSLPRGEVGRAVGDADHASIGTSVTDVNDMSVTFTAVAGRLYKATFSGTLRQTGGAGAAQVFIGGISPSTRQVFDLATNARAGFCVVAYFTATGSTTVKGQAATSANTMTILGASGYRRCLIVEDVGAA